MDLIERIFFTKNLNSLIKKYESLDDLNPWAIKNIKGNTLLRFVLGVVVISLCSHVPEGKVPMFDFAGYGYLVFAGAIAVMLLMLRWHVYYDTEKYIIPYTEGFVVDGTVVHIKYFWGSVLDSTIGWKLTCGFKNISGEYQEKYYRAFDRKAVPADTKVGDVMKIAINPFRPRYSYPYLEHYLSSNCLSLKKSRE